MHGSIDTASEVKRLQKEIETSRTIKERKLVQESAAKEAQEKFQRMQNLGKMLVQEGIPPERRKKKKLHDPQGEVPPQSEMGGGLKIPFNPLTNFIVEGYAKVAAHVLE